MHLVLVWGSEPLLKEAVEHIPSLTGHSGCPWRWRLNLASRGLGTDVWVELNACIMSLGGPVTGRIGGPFVRAP